MFRSLHYAVFGVVERMGDWFLPTLARFLFAATLLFYFWNSAITKLGDDGLAALTAPNANMFSQILPMAAEAASWDIDQATTLQKAIMLSGTWAEFILPALIVIGLFTRYVSFGMIVFLAVQSWVDLYGHGGAGDLAVQGAWFDGDPSGIILDQRFYWIFPLLYLTFRGAGPLSIDRLFARREVQARY